MKKILLSILFILPLTANAQRSCIGGNVVLSGVTICGLDNDEYLAAKDAAGTGTVDMLKADGTDDTVLNAKSGELIKLSENGTAGITIDPSTASVTLASLGEIGSDSTTDALDLISFSDGTAKAKDYYSSNVLTRLVTTNHALAWGTNNIVAGGFDTSQNFAMNGTSGGNVIVSRANYGFLAGIASLPGDLNSTVGANSFASVLRSGGALFHNGSATASAGPNVYFARSKATDGSGDTAVDADFLLGRVNFYSSTGSGVAATDYQVAAHISAYADAASGVNDTPGRVAIFVSPDGSATPAEALRISQDKTTKFSGNTQWTDGTDTWRTLVGSGVMKLTAFTTDGSDDQVMSIAGGGDSAVSRGGNVRVYGNEHGNKGDVVIEAGNNSASNVLINLGSTLSKMSVYQDDLTTINFQIGQAGTWASDAGIDAGLVKVAAADTACTTTCGVANGGAFFGFDLAAGASAPVIVEADDATADVCMCFGLAVHD